MTKLLRKGAAILFGLSLIVFTGMLAYQLALMSNLYHSAAIGTYEGSVPPVWVEIIAVITGAISAAAVPFFGACVIDRADKILELRRGAGK